jgi:hypothetical protein
MSAAAAASGGLCPHFQLGGYARWDFDPAAASRKITLQSAERAERPVFLSGTFQFSGTAVVTERAWIYWRLEKTAWLRCLIGTLEEPRKLSVPTTKMYQICRLYSLLVAHFFSCSFCYIYIVQYMFSSLCLPDFESEQAWCCPCVVGSVFCNFHARADILWMTRRNSEITS